jgi:branched-chain amino acid transport system substrate-binding protein
MLTLRPAHRLLLSIFLFVPAVLAAHIREGEAVTIGLLLPDREHADVVKAAELAIDQANREGGYHGSEFRLVVRTAEGFWGAGSKESVSLVYEDEVRAIVGSLDGRNGHLAEQVATKSHLAYIECLATDPTLSQAFVPWFTRVVPNDNQQARALVAEIRARGGGKTALLSSGDYDTGYAARSLTKALAQAGITPMILERDAGQDADPLIEKILEADVRHLILLFGSPWIDRLVAGLKQHRPGLYLYGTLHFHMDLEQRPAPLENYEGACLVGSAHPWTRSGQILMTRWSEHYAGFPQLPQVYVYDAVRQVIAAIHRVGLDREKISQCLLEGIFEDASTGSIRFDELGNRLDAVTLVGVKEGRLIRIAPGP